jgi:hypothetical protein
MLTKKKWGQEKKFIDSPVFFPPFPRFTRFTFLKILPGTERWKDFFNKGLNFTWFLFILMVWQRRKML